MADDPTRPRAPATAAVAPALAAQVRPARTARRLLPAALERHGARRRRGRLRPGDRRPDGRDLRTARCGRREQDRVAQPLARRADAERRCSSAPCRGSATTPASSSTRPSAATDRTTAEARLRENLGHDGHEDGGRARRSSSSTSTATSACRRVPGLEGIAQADQPYFQRGVSHTTVQNVYTSPLTGGPTITVATPLFDQNGGGQRVGVARRQPPARAAGPDHPREDRARRDRARRTSGHATRASSTSG